MKRSTEVLGYQRSSAEYGSPTARRVRLGSHRGVDQNLNGDLSRNASEQALVKRIKLGDDQARHELIVANMGLVFAIAQRYKRIAGARDDLIQEGNLGLVRASRDFDPGTHGVLFGSYAAIWIRSFMYRALIRDGLVIRLPRVKRLSKAQHREKMATTDEERAVLEDCYEEREKETAVCEDWYGSKHPALTRSPFGFGKDIRKVRKRKSGGSNVDLDELAADSILPEETLVRAEQNDLLVKAFGNLGLVEAWVIYHRFGLESVVSEKTRMIEDNLHIELGQSACGFGSIDRKDFGNRRERYYNSTYRELARRLGLSAYRVRQIERSAVDKLRQCLSLNVTLNQA